MNRSDPGTALQNSAPGRIGPAEAHFRSMIQVHEAVFGKSFADAAAMPLPPPEH